MASAAPEPHMLVTGVQQGASEGFSSVLGSKDPRGAQQHIPFSHHAQAKPLLTLRNQAHPLCFFLPHCPEPSWHSRWHRSGADTEPPTSFPLHPWAKLTAFLCLQHHPGRPSPPSPSAVPALPEALESCCCVELGYLPSPVLPGVSQGLRRANELWGCLGVMPGASTSNTLLLPRRARGCHHLNSSAPARVRKQSSQGPAPPPPPQPWAWGIRCAGVPALHSSGDTKTFDPACLELTAVMLGSSPLPGPLCLPCRSSSDRPPLRVRDSPGTVPQAGPAELCPLQTSLQFRQDQSWDQKGQERCWSPWEVALHCLGLLP